MPRKQTAAVDLASVNNQALAHARTTLTKVSFGLGSLDEAEFEQAMGTILSQLALAFAAGYAAAVKDRG